MLEHCLEAPLGLHMGILLEDVIHVLSQSPRERIWSIKYQLVSELWVLQGLRCSSLLLHTVVQLVSLFQCPTCLCLSISQVLVCFSLAELKLCSMSAHLYISLIFLLSSLPDDQRAALCRRDPCTQVLQIQ